MIQLLRKIWFDRNEVVFQTTMALKEVFWKSFKTQFLEYILSKKEWAFYHKKNTEGQIYFSFYMYFKKEMVMNIPIETTKEALMTYDGGSRGNPGVGGSGAVYLEQVKTEWQPKRIFSIYLGSKNTTNNVAEYIGLIKGMQTAKAQQVTNLKIIGDSMLLTNQMKRIFLPKQEQMQIFFRKAQYLYSYFRKVTIIHSRREGNKGADWLANEAMDKTKSVIRKKIMGNFPVDFLTAIFSDLRYNERWLVSPTDRPPDN